ncbi:GNAT family N-acetyltransferase [Streptomyces sp. NRRL F-5135]|uniref:GNAT family N-acetyltransferase n=1 Tax=Streptomyces sp. NRRL F-5135 TaxID=1463858 RepID=UPI0004C6B00B|nr:GNAT family N-acetyltransferase [Streptomyces sp. NRRL F-5135]
MDTMIRRATTVAELMAAGTLFDGPPRIDWAECFLASPGHLMLIAYADDRPVGMASGVEMTHPDKGTEMCLYELAVAEPYRRAGIGRALAEALAAEARERGCYDMWVGVETGNDPALATYRSAGAREEGTCSVLTWDFSG